MHWVLAIRAREKGVPDSLYIRFGILQQMGLNAGGCLSSETLTSSTAGRFRFRRSLSMQTELRCIRTVYRERFPKKKEKGLVLSWRCCERNRLRGPLCESGDSAQEARRGVLLLRTLTDADAWADANRSRKHAP